jgi:hypothetical protein
VTVAQKLRFDLEKMENWNPTKLEIKAQGMLKSAANQDTLIYGFRERVDDGYSSVEEWRVVKEYSRKGHGTESSQALK